MGLWTQGCIAVAVPNVAIQESVIVENRPDALAGEQVLEHILENSSGFEWLKLSRSFFGKPVGWFDCREISKNWVLGVGCTSDVFIGEDLLGFNWDLVHISKVLHFFLAHGWSLYNPTDMAHWRRADGGKQWWENPPFQEEEEAVSTTWHIWVPGSKPTIPNCLFFSFAIVYLVCVLWLKLPCCTSNYQVLNPP